MYWDKDIETMTVPALRDLQLHKVNDTLARARRSQYYGQLLVERGVEQLASLSDLERLPFTTKDDLRAHFPYGFLAIDRQDCVRLHSSSGTTGIPTVVYYDRFDVDMWANLVARCMYMTGARPGDVFQNMMGYGLFTGGLGFHYGAEKLGMLTVPAGPGNSQRQLWFMRQFGTTVVHILPSYAMHLQTACAEAGVEPKRDLSLRIAFIGAEPHSAEIRQKIETFYGVKAYDSYGLSEMCGPGVAFECPQQQGMHIWEDAFYAEIVDPQTGRLLDDGAEGELVLTTLAKHAMPLLRYRTRDLTRLIREGCACGRTHARIDRIKGRSDDMLIINGVNIFPVQIEKVLMKIPEIGRNYLIEIVKQDYMDKLIVKVELDEHAFQGTLDQLEQLQRRICDKLRTELVVTPAVKLVEAGSLPVSEGKAKRVYDLRKTQ